MISSDPIRIAVTWAVTAVTVVVLSLFVGSAETSAAATSGPSSPMIAGGAASARTTPVSAKLLGLNNGAAIDHLRVDAPGEKSADSVAGAKVRLFRIKHGELTKVATSVLNKHGDRKFTVEDGNGRNYTKYVAKVSATETTYATTSNTKRVR